MQWENIPIANENYVLLGFKQQLLFWHFAIWVKYLLVPTWTSNHLSSCFTKSECTISKLGESTNSATGKCSIFTKLDQIVGEPFVGVFKILHRSLHLSLFWIIGSVVAIQSGFWNGYGVKWDHSVPCSTGQFFVRFSGKHFIQGHL